jgi:hypothetical protein
LKAEITHGCTITSVVVTQTCIHCIASRAIVHVATPNRARLTQYTAPACDLILGVKSQYGVVTIAWQALHASEERGVECIADASGERVGITIHRHVEITLNATTAVAGGSTISTHGLSGSLVAPSLVAVEVQAWVEGVTETDLGLRRRCGIAHQLANIRVLAIGVEGITRHQRSFRGIAWSHVIVAFTRKKITGIRVSLTIATQSVDGVSHEGFAQAVCDVAVEDDKVSTIHERTASPLHFTSDIDRIPADLNDSSIHGLIHEDISQCTTWLRDVDGKEGAKLVSRKLQRRDPCIDGKGGVPRITRGVVDNAVGIFVRGVARDLTRNSMHTTE